MKMKAYMTIILLGVCTDMKLGLTLREQNKLKAFENSELMRIFKPRRQDMTGDR
jgi:hypothetical protein